MIHVDGTSEQAHNNPSPTNSLSPITDPPNSDPPAANNPLPQPDPSAEDRLSRQSTPLSELSPPPDDLDTPAPDLPADALEHKKERPDTPPPPPSDPTPASPSSLDSSFLAPSGPPHSPSHLSDSKVMTMLEINAELFKVLFQFQARGLTASDPLFVQYASRLQANLAFLASYADNPTPPRHVAPPKMDPLPPIDIFPTDRLRQLVSELPTLFAKELARQQLNLNASLPHSNNVPLKRERPDESLEMMMMNKRRDTGDSKLSSASMPPPDLAMNMNMGMGMGMNGAPASAGQDGMMAESQMAAMRARQQQQQQAQMRAQLGGGGPGSSGGSGGRQMSPPSNPSPGGGASGINLESLPPPMRHAYQLLQHPNHQMMQFVLRAVPNLMQLPLQQQLSKIVQVSFGLYFV
ncbi:hypothetical protein D9758_007493 [Tetrapyrgos nigripes]|uniref:Uncharacterized protein n=1 Tax=Tetrapyrgos nigripes TaxID=182062 RepID=A0A8H5LHG0_9AGAR|nr:hypothetical protein D9758_007493 [Tetrapyrgos nigripes]